MSSEPEKFSNIHINYEIENRPDNKIDYNKDDSNSTSINSQITNGTSKNNCVRSSRKNKIKNIQRSLTSILLLSNKKNLFIEEEFFPDKEDSAIDLLFFTNKNENQKNKENDKNKKFKEKKNEITENKIETKEKEDNKNVNNINNVNNVKNNNINKNTYLKNSENHSVNKNINKSMIKKANKNDNYTQTYSRSDFKDKPPKMSSLFIHDYDYENKNIFSHSNEISGIIKESKKISNVFYNHLLVNKENNEKYITTSLNKNNDGKLSTFIFYAP